VGDWTRLVSTDAATGDVAVITSANSRVSFDAASGGGYTTGFGSTIRLKLDAVNNEYTLTARDGSTQVFYDLSASVVPERRGRLKSRTDAAGNAVTVTAYDAAGRPLGLQKVDAATGETERLAYTYNSAGQVATVTRERMPAGGAFATVRSTELSYATPAGASGPALVGTVDKDGAGAVLGETYTRYYASGATAGYAGALKFHLGADAVARLQQAYPATALDALTDAQVSAYADNYFEYDASGRVTKVVTAGAGCSACDGGLGTYTLSYGTRAAGSYGVNEWRAVVTETRDDGTVTKRYANTSGQTLLTAVTEPGAGGRTWVSYTRYTADGQVALTAAPSAVTGYSESYADLVGYSGGNATYLSDTAGLVTVYTYGSSTTATLSAAGDAIGYLKQSAIQQGETGTAVPQQTLTYILNTVGGMNFFHLASETVYRNDNGTGGQTTSYSYTFRSGTNDIAATTVTLPAVTTAQNGSNSATTVTTVNDAFGRPVWQKDQAGFLTYTAYDPATGAVVKTITDADTTQTGTFASLPSGWATPSGGGLHLTTRYEVDALGRATKVTAPNGRVDYTVYDDDAHEVRSYSGWDATTNRPTGPTTVTRQDRANGYTETLTMSAAPAVSGGRPTGAEAISQVQSLSRTYVNAVGCANASSWSVSR
ncbi:hypothetical protein R5W24_006560, partial [Gemmata sp. JC717]